MKIKMMKAKKIIALFVASQMVFPANLFCSVQPNSILQPDTVTPPAQTTPVDKAASSSQINNTTQKDPTAAFLGSAPLAAASAATVSTKSVSINIKNSFQSADFSQSVNMQMSGLDSGIVTDASNQQVGTYIIHRTDSSRYFVVLTVKRPDNGQNMSHLFWSDDKGQLNYVSSDQTSTMMNSSSTVNDVWKVLDRFFKDPFALTATDYAALQPLLRKDGAAGDPNDPIFSSPEGKSNLIPAYLTRLLNAYAANPTFEFASGIDPLAAYSAEKDFVRSAPKGAVIDQLNSIWSQLTLKTKGMWISKLTNGNSQSLGKLATLLNSYLDSLSQILPSSPDVLTVCSGVAGILGVTGILSSIIASPTESGSVKQNLLNKVFNFCTGYMFMYQEYALPIVAFIAKVLLPHDGFGISISSYMASIQNFLYLVFENTKDGSRDYYTFTMIFGALSHLIPTTAKYVDNIAKYISQSIFSSIALLALDALKGPISDTVRSYIETQLMSVSQNLDSLSLRDFQDLVLNVSDKPLSLSAANEATFINSLITYLRNHFTQRTSVRIGDTYLYDQLLQKTIFWAKSSTQASSYVNAMTPLLTQFNPQQTGEATAAYQARMTKVKGLFANYGIFVEDLAGATVNGAMGVGKTSKDYIDLIIAAAKSGMATVDVINFSEAAGNENGASNFRSIRIVYKNLETPAAFSLTLFHEWLHTWLSWTNLSNSEANDMLRYYFYEYNNSTSHPDLPVFYAWTNPQELFSNTVYDPLGKSILLDPEKSLLNAANFAASGSPTLLSIMLSIIRNLKPADLPAGMMAMPKINVVTGELQFDAVQTNWQVGNAANGIQILTYGSKTYRFRYEAGLVKEAGYFGDSRFDVNKDGYITPLDVLVIINAINLAQGNFLKVTPANAGLDANNDGYITALDALVVVNCLNDASSIRDLTILRSPGQPEGEVGQPPALTADGVFTTIQRAYDAIDARLGSSKYNVSYDVDRDGVVSRADVNAIANGLGKLLPEDQQVILRTKTILDQKVYDANGRLIKAALYKAYPPILLGTNIYTYNSSGVLYYMRRDDTAGKKIREEYYNAVTGKLTTVYQYNPANGIRTRYEYYVNGIIANSCSYDSMTGALIQYEYYNAAGKLTQTYTWNPVKRIWVRNVY